MTQEKHGILCSFPLTCGCGHVGNFVYMRWCGACGDAICPTCFVPSEADKYPYRCAKCISERRLTKMEIAVREAKHEYWRKREEAFFAAIYGHLAIVPILCHNSE